MKKMAELKRIVYECWKDLSTFNDAVVQPETFKAEVRQFGDLRFKETWKQAYVSFFARNIYDANMDNRSLVTVDLNIGPDRWDWELRHRLLDAFLALPEGLDCVVNGLEQIFGDPLDREEETIAHGLLSMVTAESGAVGRVAAGPIWQLAGSR